MRKFHFKTSDVGDANISKNQDATEEEGDIAFHYILQSMAHQDLDLQMSFKSRAARFNKENMFN